VLRLQFLFPCRHPLLPHTQPCLHGSAYGLLPCYLWFSVRLPYAIALCDALRFDSWWNAFLHFCSRGVLPGDPATGAGRILRFDHCVHRGTYAAFVRARDACGTAACHALCARWTADVLRVSTITFAARLHATSLLPARASLCIWTITKTWTTTWFVHTGRAGVVWRGSWNVYRLLSVFHYRGW